MDFLSEENIKMLCEIHETPPLSFDMMKNYASVFISQHNEKIISDNLLELNKNFLIHLHLHHQTNRNEIPKLTKNQSYVNEYVPPIPPTPDFLLSSEQDEVLTDGSLDILIQTKMKERENELINIRSQFNTPDEPVESVKLIKISNLLTDLDLMETSDVINVDLRKKISIGSTTVFEYNENEPPNKTTNSLETIKMDIERLNEIHNEYVTLLQSIMNNMDKM